MDEAREPTQETQPKKGDPVTIPVPEKDDVMAAFRKVAKATGHPREERGASPPDT